MSERMHVPDALRGTGVIWVFLGGMAGTFVRFAPADLPESKQLRLARLYPGSQIRRAAGHVLIPRPMTRPIAGRPIVDTELLAWATTVLDDIF